MIFKIKISDKTIEIHSLFDAVYKHCSEYITQSDGADITVKITPEDIAAEKEKALNEQNFKGEVAPGLPDSLLEINAVYRKICSALIHHSVILLHGSAVAAEGKAYVFIAPSGTGKTTHTNLWLKNIPGSFIINGDKPLLRVTDGKAMVYGTPWCGKEGLQTNTNVDLKAIIVLERAENNSITKIDFKEIFPTLLGQTYRSTNKSDTLKTVEIINKISQSVEFYRIKCNMLDEASSLAFAYMNNSPI